MFIKIEKTEKIKITPVKIMKMVIPHEEDRWREKCGYWWNMWAELDHKSSDGLQLDHVHKTPQLYLVGDPGIGKTSFIEKLLDKYIKKGQCFYAKPSVSSRCMFSYGGFIEGFVRVSWFDEFSESSYDLEDLKKFLAGEKMYKERKNKDAEPFTNRYPVLISSNHEPPQHDAFQPDKGRRLFIVRCSKPKAECDAVKTSFTSSNRQRKLTFGN